MENIETIINNSKEYSKNKDSKDILRNADGKNNYKEIAKILELHPTYVSGLLKKANQFGLVTKIKSGLYKKIPGILGYMPKNSAKKKISKNNVKHITEKLLKIQKPNKLKDIGLAIPNYIIKNISENNNKVYNLLFSTENTIRELIRIVLSEKDKINWWKNYIPNGIQKDVEETINKTPYHANKRRDELEYTHMGHLKEIIINKKNWNDFLPYLNETDKNSFIVIIDKAIPVRNAIGHCIPLNSTDLKEVDVRFNDILKMIK